MNLSNSVIVTYIWYPGALFNVWSCKLSLINSPKWASQGVYPLFTILVDSVGITLYKVVDNTIVTLIDSRLIIELNSKQGL